MDTQARRINRLQSIKDCQTPTDLAYNIWTKESDISIGDRSHFRNPFINWVESYKTKSTPQWTSYKTPRDLVNGIWKPYLDRPDDNGLFSDLRNAVIEWIERYAQTS